MAKKTWNEPIDKNVDWAGDENTDNLPVSGAMVQKFIKDSLNGKAGLFYYDTANNRYIVFADEGCRDEYLEDPTRTDLIIGVFDAPFNYSAEINLLSPAYNAISLGSTGNYIEFTFDVKNKQGASTGENVNITYTVIRNAVKKTFTETRKFGDAVRFNIDSYLDEGTNTVIVGVTGQSTLAATTVAITYQVINLVLTDEMDISKVYDLSSTTSMDMEIPFTVSGYGTKVVEWYLDGALLEFVKSEDEVVDVSTSRVKYISLSNLQHGRHSLQIRAYTVINGERFYTPTFYRDIIVNTGVGTSVIIGVALEIPSKYGIVGASDPLTLYDMEQYVPYTLRFATYSPLNSQNTEVTIEFDGETKGTVMSVNETETFFTVIPATHGSKILRLISGEIEYALSAEVKPTSMNIQEIISGLSLDFRASGRNNASADRDRWTYGAYTGILKGFNWNNTSGWVDNRLLMNAGSTFTIDMSPLAGNPTDSGKTIEFEFSTRNVRNDNAIICDLRGNNGVGILITATKVSLTSANGVVVETEFKSDENVRIGFVINRKSGSTNKGLSFIYTNGIISRGEKWSALDNYTSPTTIKFQATDDAEVSLKAIRVYDVALSSDQMLNNFILYRDTLEEMLEVYDRNDVYEEGTITFSPDKMMSRIPVMIVTGDIPVLENTSDKNTQIIVDIDYYNLQDPTRSFRMVGAAMRPQGTSSMGYPKKNFRIYTKKVGGTILYDYNGKIVSDKLYSFRQGAQPVNTWCLKADYAESSGTHNTGIARMWNNALMNVQVDGEYVCRTNAQKVAAESGYEYDVRTAIDGFPILLFYRLTVNDELIFIGKYNFNNDKSTESVFGFKGIPGFDNSRMQCWEVLNNGNPLALFTTADNFDSEWGEAFESRYPDTSSPNTSDLKAFCEWMVNVTQEDFASQKWEHFNVYMMAAYWVYLMRHAGADQFVKNAMFTSEDGQHFYYILYDNDTINGLINTGRLRITPTDDRQTTDDSGAYVFAGHDSRLWNMLEADSEFQDVVKKVDNALYSAGVSYLNCLKTFDEDQADKWVERVYNQDAQYKYIGPYTDKGIDNLFMLQGKRDLHRKWWLSKRFAIFDAKYVTGPYKSQSVELKCINGTAAGQRFTITAGYPLDYGYGINDIPRSTGIHLNAGESHTFETSEVVNLGDPIRIYGATNISEIDLSQMTSALAVITITNVYDKSLGTNLKKLIIGNDEGHFNVEVTEISGLKQATRLEYLDVRWMAGITSLDLSNQIYLKSLKTRYSGVSSIIFAKGAPLVELELSDQVTILSLEQLPLLEPSGIWFDYLPGIREITIKGCPNMGKDFSFILDWLDGLDCSPNAASLVMDNIDWTGVDVDELLRLTELGTLKLKGKAQVDSITKEQLLALQDYFGQSVFDKDSEFYIDAPAAVYIIGRTELLEGESEQYQCVVFGAELQRVTYSISSGASSYISIDSATGLLTTKEGAGTKDVVMQVTVVTDSGPSVIKVDISVKARVYPTSSQTSISGNSSMSADEETYSLAYTVEVTGDITVEWSLTGMDGYVEIASSDDNSCVLRKTAMIATVVPGTLSATLKKRATGSTMFTVTKTVKAVNETIAETDAGICKALYDAGLCANETYITKAEAALITADMIQPGTSSSTSIFYAQRNNIKSFEGFQYFTGVAEIKAYMFGALSSYYAPIFDKIVLPPYVSRIRGSAFLNGVDITLNEGLITVEKNGLILYCKSNYEKILNISNTVETLNIKVESHSNYKNSDITINGGNNIVNFYAEDSGVAPTDGGRHLNVNSNKLIILVYPAAGKIISGYDNYFYLALRSKIESSLEAPKGGYFKDMTTSQEYQLEEIGTNVYKVLNVVYYSTVGFNSNMADAHFKTMYTNQEGEHVESDCVVGDNILPMKETWLSVEAMSVYEGYLTPSPRSLSFYSSYISLTMNYVEQVNLYIQHVDGSLYTADEWTAGGYSNEDANGVAFVMGIHDSFVVAKEDLEGTYKWGGRGKWITDIVTEASSSSAVLDFDGAGNTSKIIDQLTGYTDFYGITGAPAAEACAAYTFPNGKKGFLPALGQLMAFNNNRSNFNKLMSLIGGNPLGSSYEYWSSTQDSTNSNTGPYSWYVNSSFQMLITDRGQAKLVRAFGLL